MSANGITWVGMDAHKNSIKVAAWLPGQAEPIEWTEDTTAEAVQRLAHRRHGARVVRVRVGGAAPGGSGHTQLSRNRSRTNCEEGG